MRALVLNCTVKPSPAASNTEALAQVVVDSLREKAVEVTWSASWTSTSPRGWRRTSVRVTNGRRSMTSSWPATSVVTGNEDGAHHVITEVAGALIDIGFTIPGQAWTYWNMGPGPGPSYTETDHKHDWSESTGRTMAANLLAAATALRAHPLPPAG